VKIPVWIGFQGRPLKTAGKEFYGPHRTQPLISTPVTELLVMTFQLPSCYVKQFQSLEIKER